MPAKVGQLELDFLLNLAQFQTDLNKSVTATEKAATQMQKSMSNAMKGVAASVATIGVGVVFQQLTKNIDEAESSIAQVNASIRSTGGVAGVTAKQVEDLAQSMKKLNGVDDDAVRSMASVLLTFTKVGKETFPQATQAIVDMSAKLGTDLKSSAIQVGKALNDPIKGVSALQRVGVSFTESQKALIKSLVDSGKSLEAQKIILRELETEFGGAAAAARDTLGGALKALDISVGDVWQSIGGGAGGGLRLAVEMLNIGMEKTAATITDMQNPATQIGKTFQSIGKDFEAGALSAMVWSNAAIFGIKAVGFEAEKFAKQNKSWLNFGMVGDAVAKGDFGLAGKAFEMFGAKVQETDKGLKDLQKTGMLPNYFQGLFDSVNEAQKRMDDLHKAASKYKGPGKGGEDVEVKSKKELDALAKQRKAMDDILRAYEQKNEAVGQQTIEQKAMLEMMEAERKISNLTNVPLRERLSAINEIAAATKERIRLENESKIKEQGTALKDMLADMQKEVQLGANKKDDQEELNILVEAEARVREMTKGYAGENLDLQNQILDVARKQVEAAKAMKHDAALKTLREITQQYDDEYQSLLDQIAGTENLNKLRKETERINATKGLSDDEKNAAISHITDLDSKTRALNKTYKDSESLVDNIAASEANHTEKVKALQQAYADKQLNERQFAEGLNKIASSSDKAKSAASSFVGILSSGFNNIFQGGQKVTDIFKQMGKSLLELTAKTLFFGPIEKAMTGFADRFLGGSGKKAAVANLPPGVVQDPNGKYSYDPTGSASSYWPSNLPNKATGATGAAQTGMLGSALGGAAGLGGLLSSGKASLGNLFGLFGGKSPSTGSGLGSLLGSALSGALPLQQAGTPQVASSQNPQLAMVDLLKSIDSNVAKILNQGGISSPAGSLQQIAKKAVKKVLPNGNAWSNDPNGWLPDSFFDKEAEAEEANKGLKKITTGAFSPIMGGAVGSSGVLTSTANNQVKQVEKTVNSGVTGLFNNLTTSLKSGFSALTTPVTSTIKNLFTGSTVSGLFSSITSSIGSLLGGLTSAIKGGLSSLLAPITSSIGKLFGGGSSGGGGGLLSGISKAFGSVGSSLGGSFKSWFGGGSSGGSLFSGLGKAAGSLGSSLMGSLGSWFGGGNSQSYSGDPNGYMMQGFGSLDQYAAGGWAGSGEPFVAGENGREIIWPGAQAAYVMNNQQTERLMGGGGFGGYGQSNGGYSQGSGSRYGGALSDIGGWQQQLQSGYNTSNQQLGYFERQELSQKISERYRSTMNWNDGSQMQLAQVADATAKEQARRWLQNPTKYKGVINDNEYARMSLRATYGTGAVDAVTAGGRAGWGAGDQMLANLQEAQAIGVPVSQQLLDQARFDKSSWQQGTSIFNPMGNMDPTNWIGRGSYHSMGVGAGEGNTNYGAVYGGDFWDTASGANGSERMDALGGKQYMWDKFHGGVGAGYEKIKDMWSFFKSGNYSFGGGNFIGDRNYGRSVKDYAFQGPTNGGPSKGDIALPHYDDKVWPRPKNWEENLADAGYPYKAEEGNVNGLDMSREALSRRARQTVAGSEEGRGIADYLSKLLGRKYTPELGTIDAFRQHARKLIADSNSTFTGDRTTGTDGLLKQMLKPLSGFTNSWNRKPQINIPGLSPLATGSDMDALMAGVSGMYGGGPKSGLLEQMLKPLKGAGDSWKSTKQIDIPGLGPLASRVDMEALMARAFGMNRVESHMNGIGFGGAVGAPGKLTTSYGDVFDQQTSVKARNPYFNMADGFDDGYFAARTGADRGATRPRSGWAYGGPRAEGGHVDKNMMYKVLEHGDEAFIPDTAGRIMPMNKLMGGSPPNIQILDRAGVNIKTKRSANGRDTTFELTSIVAQDNVNGAGAKTLAAVYGLERQPTRRG